MPARSLSPTPIGPHQGARVVQGALALPLLVPPLVGREVGTVFMYYGLVILVLPRVIDAVARTHLAAFQRLAITVGIGLHGYGLLLDIYWRFQWWDMVTHFVSGSLLAAGFYVVVLGVTGPGNHRPKLTDHLAVLVLMIASGLCWEVYEVIAPWQTIYPTGDALSDIVVNVLGWALVAIVHPYVLGDLPASVETRLAEFSTDTVSVGRAD